MRWGGGGSKNYQAKSSENQNWWGGGGRGGPKIAQNVLVLEFLKSAEIFKTGKFLVSAKRPSEVKDKNVKNHNETWCYYHPSVWMVIISLRSVCLSVCLFRTAFELLNCYS